MAVQPPNTPSRLLRGNYTTPLKPHKLRNPHPSINQQGTTDPYDFINHFPDNAPNSPSVQTTTTNTPETNNQLFETPSIEIQEVIRRWDVEYTKPNGASFHEIETERGFNIVITSKSNSRVLTTPAAPINRELFPKSGNLLNISNSQSEEPVARQLFLGSPVADSDEGNTSADSQSIEDVTLSPISIASSDEFLTDTQEDLDLSDDEGTDNEGSTTNIKNNLAGVRKNLFGDEDEGGSASF